MGPRQFVMLLSFSTSKQKLWINSNFNLPISRSSPKQRAWSAGNVFRANPWVNDNKKHVQIECDVRKYLPYTYCISTFRTVLISSCCDLISTLDSIWWIAPENRPSALTCQGNKDTVSLNSALGMSPVFTRLSAKMLVVRDMPYFEFVIFPPSAFWSFGVGSRLVINVTASSAQVTWPKKYDNHIKTTVFMNQLNRTTCGCQILTSLANLCGWMIRQNNPFRNWDDPCCTCVHEQ